MSPRRRTLHLGMIGWLSVVWVLLWGDLSIANVLSGLVLGLGVTLVFPLPAIAFKGRLNPVGIAILLGRFGWDLIRSSVEVALAAFRFGHTPRSAVIEVKLRSRSDLYLTIIADLVSLVPGSLVVEARRTASTLFIHIFDTRRPEDIERARAEVLAVEARVLRAFGSRAEIAALNSGAEELSQ